MFVSILLYISFANVVVLADVLDLGNNGVVGDEPKVFRTLKYNHIWEKALRQLEKQDLDILNGILKKLDKQEIELKHLKDKHGENYDKEFENGIRTHLMNTLERFGLYKTGVDRKHYEKITFEDQRLNRLWNQALKEGHYEGEELESLYEEIQHMQSKINDYRKLTDKVDRHEDKLNKHMKKDKNMATREFSKPKDKQFTDDAKTFKNIKQDQHDKYHSLKEQVQVLEETVSGRGANPSKTFSDSRVSELWNVATKSERFNDKELEAIKSELEDFQDRVNKLRHWERRQDRLHESVHEDGFQSMSDEYLQAKEKVKHHKKYVKKYHATMMDRIYEHTEL